MHTQWTSTREHIPEVAPQPHLWSTRMFSTQTRGTAERQAVDATPRVTGGETAALMHRHCRSGLQTAWAILPSRQPTVARSAPESQTVPIASDNIAVGFRR